MNRVHQAFSLALIAFSIWVMVQALQMNYYTTLGPGPGFFPFWLAFAMMVFSGIWFVQLWMKPVPGRARAFVPGKTGFLRVIAIIVSVVVFGLLVERAGFALVMFGLLVFLLFALGKQKIVTTLVISALGSFGVYFVFTKYLALHLPHSSIDFLRNLGF